MPYKDKERQAKAVRESYERNKKAYREKENLIVQRNKRFVLKYLETHPCIDCGESDPIVLDFDHVRGVKIANVSRGVRDRWDIEKLKEEIFKCEVRCANCHRRITYIRGHNG